MFDLALDSTGRFVRLKLSGNLTLSQLVGAYFNWVENPQFDPAIHVLFDLTSCDWQQAAEQFELVADDVVERMRGIRDGGKTAWLVESVTEARIVETLFGKRGWPTIWRAFVSDVEASAWLTE